MKNSDAKPTQADLECGGKRSATPLSTPAAPAPKTVSSLRSATAVQKSLPFATSLSQASLIAAVFCALVSAAMLYQHSVAAERDPWKSPQLLGLKEKLRAAPTDETIKTEIRRLDLEFRQRYVRRLSLDRTGGWLLVGGIAAMVLAAGLTAKLRAQSPIPQLKTDTAAQALHTRTQSRRAVAVVGLLAAAGLATLALTATSPLPASTAELEKLLGRAPGGEPVADTPSLAEFQANWPRFRGATGGGVAASTNGLSFALDEKSGAGVLWKALVPAPGVNSPVVWSNRVFVSGGDAKKREVFCFDAADGKLLWRRAVENVPGGPATQPQIGEPPGFAAPTMACDGRRAFVIFANGDLAAFTFDGSPAWSKNIGVPKNMYGHATSLAVWPGKLIVQLDQDEGAPGGSKLLAFDCGTGRLLWERSRAVYGSWATPIIIEAVGKTQIITLALPNVIGYSLADGNELWRAAVMEGEITPSPIFAGGFVVLASPSKGLIAIRPDGAGDVTKSHVAWTTEENVPDITSPVSNGEFVFTVTSSGLLTCFGAKDGEKIWEKDLAMEVQSSPGIAGDRLLVLSTKGNVVVAEAGREFKELGRAKLDDQFDASPAFANGRVFLRGATNLWCLGGKQ
jgi:outer membrane protein assembly factor BamB